MCNLSAASESQRLRGSFKGCLWALLRGWHNRGPGRRACLTALIYVPLMKLWLGFPRVLLTTHAPLVCVLLPSAAIWSRLQHCAILTAPKEFYNCSHCSCFVEVKGCQMHQWKFCHHLPTLMSFQTYMTFFLPWNTEEDLENRRTVFVQSIKSKSLVWNSMMVSKLTELQF